MKSASILSAACAALSGLVFSSTLADQVSVIGATLRVNNPNGPAPVTVEAKFLGDSTSLYDNELFLDAPTFQGPIFNNHSTPVGATAGLGSFQPETVLFIRNQSFLIPNPGGPASYNFGWFTGNGNLPPNPDGLPHAVFTFDTDNPDDPVTVSFEDEFGGGDLDFNDAVYSFTNTRAGFVDVALSPIDIPVGDTVTVDEDEIRYMSPFQQDFSNSGTIDNNGSIFNYGSAVNSGTFDNHDQFFNDLPGEFRNAFGALLNNEGVVRSFGPVINEGEINNSGTLHFFETLRSMGPVISSVGGIIGAAKGASVRNEDTITNQGSVENAGDWVNAPGSEMVNTGSVINAGTFTVENGANVTGDGTYGQITGELTTIDGTLEAATVDIQGGTVNGTGTIRGTFNLINGATLGPGHSPGTLTIDGDFNLNGGTLEIELESLTGHDFLAISGAATFTGGTVNYLFSFTPNAGDSFTILTADGGISGAETLSYTVVGDGSGLNFDTAVVGNSLVLTATAPPDADGDLIPDADDNCIDAQNGDQRDSNSDGFGNVCDGDLNNIGALVNFSDLALFRTAFGTTDADADLDGDGTVNFGDLAIFRSLFGKPPGPSGVVP